ncbi:MAG: hypothetical protein IJD86_13860 [Clostridia bacterium]|nr:hypothetical protein [Clostridia bacterium]
MKTKEISVCSISAAYGVGILLIGFYLSFGEFFWYFAASLFMNLPKTPQGKWLSYIICSVLAMLLCSFHFIYLASFIFLMGPYAAVTACTENFTPVLKHACRIAHFAVGLLLICYFTPMFLIQLSVQRSAAVIIPAIIAIIIISAVVEPLYDRLYSHVSRIVLKRSRKTS